MTQKLPQMAQNYPKWPKNDARIYALFLQFFLTEKAIPQTFSLLECMARASTGILSRIFLKLNAAKKEEGQVG